jgi:tetratricopeptide (TPR) repeat protein
MTPRGIADYAAHMRGRFFSYLVLGVLTIAAPAAHADQKDPRLPVLFDQLKAAPDGDAAGAIEQQIWRIWVVAGDPEIDGLMSEGEREMTAAHYPQALQAFNRIVAKRPDFAEGWNRRATLYYLMGEYQKSEDDIARVLALEPRHFGALSGLGLVNIKLGRMEEAADAYRRYLEVNPQNDDAKQTLEMIDMVLKRKSI